MRISKRKFTYGSPVVLMATASLLFTTASPAAAAVVASGASVAYDYPTGVGTPPGPCLPTGNPLAITVATNTLESDQYATYAGLGPAVYAGPTHIKVEAGAHFISPLGTHLGCPALTPDAIPVKATVTGSNTLLGANGSITCTPTGNNGTWRRVAAAVVIDFTESCTVVGNVVAGTVTSNVHHILALTGVPCVVPLTDVTIPACQFPAPPIPGPGAIYTGTFVAEDLV